MELRIREASSEDAVAACEVLRRSIVELCSADHRNDATVITEWLENKTPENVRRWLDSPLTYGVVAERNGSVCGFAMVGMNGTISLCHVLPEVQHRGAGKRMLAALEAQAARWNLESLRVESTLTAGEFYERNGYSSVGESIPAPAPNGGYLLRKLLAR
jgi:N-acetylglutamate synthase-like GNAT family acetyltransferase